MSQVRTNSLVPAGGIPGGASGGGIIQVVSVIKTDTFSSTSTSFADISGLSVSITPQTTSNKILILCQINHGQSPEAGQTIRLMRGGTAIAIGDAAGVRTRGSTGLPYLNIYNIESHSIIHVDSPATTSSTTYKLQMIACGGTIHHINRNGYDDNRIFDARTTSSITVLEVSG